MCSRDYVSGWRPVWFCWGFQSVCPMASGVTSPAEGLIALNMVQLPARWSGSIRVNAWWNRWRDVIAVHAAISSWAYSRLTAVLLGACSYAKWSIFWAITMMYITVYIYIYVLSLFLSSLHAIFYLLFYPFNVMCMFNTGYNLSFYILYWFYLMYLSEMTKKRCSIIHEPKIWCDKYDITVVKN